MSGNEIRLANGQLWTAQHFLDHYPSPMGQISQRVRRTSDAGLAISVANLQYAQKAL
jgi:hypothetical protein